MLLPWSFHDKGPEALRSLDIIGARLFSAGPVGAGVIIGMTPFP